MRGVAITLVAALCLVTACDQFAGGQARGEDTLERTTLRVGVGNALDTAPLRIAVADGSFTKAGLDIELVEQQNPQDGLAGLASGKLDVAFATDVSLFKAVAGGTALQLQGEAYASAPYTMALVTLPDSNYTELTDKRSPKIAVEQLDDLGTLAVRSMFATAGGDAGRIKFVQRSFEQMPEALRDGAADAALMVEPFITRAQQDLGARVLADSCRGATAFFPMAAYASNGMFAEANTRTLGRFRQVLADAQQHAAEQAVVRNALPQLAGIDSTTAAVVSLGQYPSSLNGVRLQRVADLMHSSGMLANRLDVVSLLPRTDPP